MRDDGRTCHSPEVQALGASVSSFFLLGAFGPRGRSNRSRLSSGTESWRSTHIQHYEEALAVQALLELHGVRRTMRPSSKRHLLAAISQRSRSGWIGGVRRARPQGTGPPGPGLEVLAVELRRAGERESGLQRHQELTAASEVPYRKQGRYTPSRVLLALTALAIIAYRAGYLRGDPFRAEARGVAVDARPASV